MSLLSFARARFNRRDFILSGLIIFCIVGTNLWAIAILLTLRFMILI